jgi:hypothetical protein
MLISTKRKILFRKVVWAKKKTKKKPHIFVLVLVLQVFFSFRFIPNVFWVQCNTCGNLQKQQVSLNKEYVLPECT